MALLALLAALAIWSRVAGRSATDYERYHNRHYTCAGIFDGDTLELDCADQAQPRTRVRLWGVDTPESARGTENAMYFAHEAAAYVRERVAGRQVRVVLATHQTRDRYGRLLAYVYLPQKGREMMLNEEIIASGHGYADRRFNHLWRLRFEQLEERAERKGLGLWDHIEPHQMPDWRQRYLERSGARTATK